MNTTPQVPKELYKKTPFISAMKIALAILLMSLSVMLSFSFSFSLMGFSGIIGLGLMMSHKVELAHELLHDHMTEKENLSRAFGILLGLPMMVSYSEYRYNHLVHHACLGTLKNSENFSYNHGFKGAWSFFEAMFNYDRLLKAFPQKVWRSLRRVNLLDGGAAEVQQKRVRMEYLLYAAVFLLTIIFFPRAALIWILGLLVAEPVHFLVELPEHFGLPAWSERDVFKNTRSLKAGWLLCWFTTITVGTLSTTGRRGCR